jgi:multidrug resistance efflux pump
MNPKPAIPGPPDEDAPDGGDAVPAPAPRASARRGSFGGLLRRLVRRCLYTVGILLVLAMSGFLVSQHLLPPFFSAGEAVAAAPHDPAAEEERKLVVCYGYADLDRGVVALHPSQAGRVEAVPVEENQEVAAGAVLLRLDDRTARLHVEEAKAVLDESLAKLSEAEKGPERHKADLARQQAAVEVARRRIASAEHTLTARQERQKVETIGRYREDPVTNQYVASSAQHVKELEEAAKLERESLRVLELKDPDLEISTARAEVATMRARLHQAEQTLEEHVLKAPGAGRVLRIMASRGEMLSMQAKPPAIQFCPDGPLIIRAEVDQAFALSLKIGLPTVVEDDGHSESRWRGHVSRIADWYTQRRMIAEEQLQMKDVRTLECVIALDPKQPPLRIGQRVRVTISRPAP